MRRSAVNRGGVKRGAPPAASPAGSARASRGAGVWSSAGGRRAAGGSPAGLGGGGLGGGHGAGGCPGVWVVGGVLRGRRESGSAGRQAARGGSAPAGARPAPSSRGVFRRERERPASRRGARCAERAEGGHGGSRGTRRGVSSDMAPHGSRELAGGPGGRSPPGVLAPGGPVNAPGRRAALMPERSPAAPPRGAWREGGPTQGGGSRGGRWGVWGVWGVRLPP